MNTKPWLSVIIPAYCGERWLALALDSLVAQTATGFECILLDGSPTDGTVAIAERYRDRLSIRIERRPDLLTWQSKTNVGVGLARADHISMLHCDDAWLPGRAAAVQAWVRDMPDTVMHLHPSWIIDDRGDRLGLWRSPLPEGAVAATLFRERLIVQNFIAICAPVIRRDAFLEAGGFDGTLWYTGDWDLYLKLARLGSIAYHPDALAAYRIHGEAMTVSGSHRPQDMRDQLQMVLDRYLPAIADGQPQLASRATASVVVNAALAEVFHGRPLAFLPALNAIMRLGPNGIALLLRDTRLVERVLPRVRSRLRGRLSPSSGKTPPPSA